MTRFCPKCSAPASPSARFCATCGVLLDVEIVAPSIPTGALTNETTLQNGRYVVENRLGQGGMGAVYAVRDQRLPGKRWAVKEMSTAGLTKSQDLRQAAEFFQREAALLASLDHRNLTRVTDYFEERSRAYLVMELVEGDSLANLLDQRAMPFSVQDVVEWGRQLCNVLTYLHTRIPPVIFRDLKPSNVMLTKDGYIKLIDFGIARHFKPGKQTDTAALGTVGYAAPEQYGQNQTTPRSDIYALGVSLHELSTRHRPSLTPFHHPSAHTLNPTVPKSLSDVLEKAMANNPEDRWSSAVEFREALEKAASSMKLAKITAPRLPTAPLSAQTVVPGMDDVADRPPTPWQLPTPSSLPKSVPSSGAAVATNRKLARVRSAPRSLTGVLLRPVVWLTPYRGALAGLVIATMLLAVASWLLFYCRQEGVPCPSLTLPAFLKGFSDTVEIVATLLVPVLGAAIGYLVGPNPKVFPPRFMTADETVFGREQVLDECQRTWNSIASTTEKEPTFVVLSGTPGVGKSMVLRHFFLKQEKQIEAAGGLKRSAAKTLPYQYVLWIDCAAGSDQAFRDLAHSLPPLLRLYYRCERKQLLFERHCCRYLERINLALFIDNLDFSQPPESLGIWDQFLHDLARRRSARLSLWIAANSQDVDYFRHLGQQRFKRIDVAALKKDAVIEIVSHTKGWSKNRSDAFVTANWKIFEGNIDNFTRSLRS